MKPAAKGILLAGLHLAMVAALGGKMLLDRVRCPRIWLKALPVDPDLPIRGRYVRLGVDLPKNTAGGGRQTLAYFIPGRVPDPSVRAAGEELWVEVTVPRRGPVRPIRLAVKRDGKLTPMVF